MDCLQMSIIFQISKIFLMALHLYISKQGGCLQFPKNGGHLPFSKEIKVIFHISSSWAEQILHTKIQLHMLHKIKFYSENKNEVVFHFQWYWVGLWYFIWLGQIIGFLGCLELPLFMWLVFFSSKVELQTGTPFLCRILFWHAALYTLHIFSFSLVRLSFALFIFAMPLRAHQKIRIDLSACRKMT